MAIPDHDPLKRTHGPCQIPYLAEPFTLNVRLPTGTDAPKLRGALQQVQFQLRGIFGPNLSIAIVEENSSND